ncbi:unnamed protein product [Prorocentrum cordatum]|uniref:Peroxisomal membrane protein MPV17 n=1 Tax=Prorocentrum cordatum TaxID=2364126 RepID=A0ABN9VUL9_9DINO|nr:unnamed protein product [Polarella glacialis]
MTVSVLAQTVRIRPCGPCAPGRGARETLAASPRRAPPPPAAGMLYALARRGSALWSKHPRAMNLATGFGLGAAADALCQLAVQKRPEMDWTHFRAFVGYMGVYQGVVVQYVYASYKYFLPAALLATPLRYGIGCTLLDSFVHCPFLYTPSYYISVNLLRGSTWQEAVDDLRANYKVTQQLCVCFWLPVMACNFALLPGNLVTFAMQVQNLIWSVILDYTSATMGEVDAYTVLSTISASVIKPVSRLC